MRLAANGAGERIDLAGFRKALQDDDGGAQGAQRPAKIGKGGLS